MRARRTPLGSAVALLLAGALALLSPGVEPWRLAAQTLNAGAPAGAPLPGGWAAAFRRFAGAGNSLPQSPPQNAFGASSLVSALVAFDLATERGRSAAQPLVSQLDSLGVTPESFEGLAPGDQRRLLENAAVAAAAGLRAETEAAATMAEGRDSRSLKEAAARLAALSATAPLYLGSEEAAGIEAMRRDVGLRVAALRESEVAGKVFAEVRGWGAPTSAIPASGGDPVLLRVEAAAPRRTDLPPAGDGKLSALQVQALHVELVNPQRTSLSEAAFKALVEGAPAQRRIYFEALAKDRGELINQILGGMYLSMTHVLDADHLGAERMPLAVGLGRRFLDFLEQVRRDRSLPGKVRAAAGVSGTLLRNEALIEELTRQKQVYGRLKALEQAALALVKAPAGRSTPAPVSAAWTIPSPIALAEKASRSDEADSIIVSLEKIGRQVGERAFMLERLRARYVGTRPGSRFSESISSRTKAELKAFVERLLSWFPGAYEDVTRFQGLTLYNQFYAPLRYAGRVKRIRRVPHTRGLRLTPEGDDFVVRALFETDIREQAVLDVVKRSIEEYWQGPFTWAGRSLHLRTEVSFKVLAPGETFSEGALFLRDGKEEPSHAPLNGIMLGHGLNYDTPAHEFGHVLGLPDEYQEVYDARRKATVHTVFPASLMGASKTGSVLERHLKTAFFLLRRRSMDPSPPGRAAPGPVAGSPLRVLDRPLAAVAGAPRARGPLLDADGSFMERLLGRLASANQGIRIELDFIPTAASLKAMGRRIREGGRDNSSEVMLFRLRRTGRWVLVKGDATEVSGAAEDYDFHLHSHTDIPIGAFRPTSALPSPLDLETSAGKSARFFVLSRDGLAEWDPRIPFPDEPGRLLSADADETESAHWRRRFEGTFWRRLVMRITFPAFYPSLLRSVGVRTVLKPWKLVTDDWLESADFDSANAPAPESASVVLRETGDVRIGVVESPAALEASYDLLQWRYLSFSTISADEAGPGEPMIDGRPAAESKLEFKRVSRRLPGEPARWRHDSSFLALGATPPGEYRVEFPGVPAFTVKVAFSDDEPPGGRLGIAAPAPDFAPGVKEDVASFLRPHLSFMSRRLADYEDYLKEDPVLDARGRGELLAELESLRSVYRDAVAGRVPWPFHALVAQLLARERRPLERYREYFRADPSNGRAYTEFALEQLDHYRTLVQDVRSIYADLDDGQPPSAFRRAAAAVFGAWFSAEIALARLYVAVKLWLFPPDRPSKSK